MNDGVHKRFTQTEIGGTAGFTRGITEVEGCVTHDSMQRLGG